MCDPAEQEEKHLRRRGSCWREQLSEGG